MTRSSGRASPAGWPSATVNLELSPAYDDEAARLFDEAGVRDRAERRLLDIAADPDGVAPADDREGSVT